MIIVEIETIVFSEPRVRPPRPGQGRKHRQVVVQPRPVGGFTCRHCGVTVSFMQGTWLVLYVLPKRHVLYKAENGARVHDCRVNRVFWCETCREPQETSQRQGVVVDKCRVCRNELRQIEVTGPVAPLKPIDLF